MKWERSSGRRFLPRAMEDVKNKNQVVTISIVLLDDKEVEFQVNRRDLGQVLLDQVFDGVYCKEPKYYGLQFPQDVPNAMKWLDPNKSIRKQFKVGYPTLLFYRVKHFVSDVNQIQDPLTRYQLFLQLKLEIFERRLACPAKIAPVLASYAIQSEMGDYDPTKHNDLYLKDFEFIPSQSSDFATEVQKLHKRHRGLSPDHALLSFLQEAIRLKRYGIDIHQGLDHEGEEMEIGVATDGVRFFQKGELCRKYEWVKIVKISFKRREFFIQLQKDKVEGDATPMVEFLMENYRACKRLWKNCVDCHSFYRKEKFCHKHGDNGPAKREMDASAGDTNKAQFDHVETDVSQLRDPQENVSCRMLNSTTTSPEDKELLPDQDTKEVTLRAPPSDTLAVQSDDLDSRENEIDHELPSNCAAGDKVSEKKKDSFTTSPEPIKSQECNAKSVLQQQTAPPQIPPQVPEPYVMLDSILSLRLKPDKSGRFGFNIRGGKDQRMPITVSKIASGSSADICEPKLNIGDEILEINGKDVSDLSHDEAVSLIRFARFDKYDGDLMLRVRPFTVLCEEAECIAEVPKILHNGPMLAPENEIDVGGLEYSMSVLENQLDTGRDMALFDRLYRKKPGLTMRDAKMPVNAPKNRYRDISPYDVTRVRLTNWETDYINGNHIVMKIPDTVENHYIACQGPLQNTCSDFWVMVWEQRATLVVMVTTTIERGMMKCFQYWPSRGCTMQIENLVVTSKNERVTSCFVFRDFEMGVLDSSGEVVEKRVISHIQYVAWPDHGVPDESSDFLDFINCVRQKREAMTVPTIVHCSAGIGRTGVMIAVETAMCLIEANRPVFPLEITQRMRDQRPMMIQTALQFRFVCEAILRVYKHGIIKPDFGGGDNEND